MKYLLLLITVLGINYASAQQVLTRTNTAATTNKSWQIYRQNSPTNVYGNSYVLLEVNHDSMFVYTNIVRIAILDDRLGIAPDKKYVSADSNGVIYQASFDSLTFPISQIDSLYEMLMDRPTLADGALLYKSISYAPTYTDVITGLGFEPYDGVLNPLGFISTYSETDPSFDTKFATKSTTNLTEGSNLYYTNARSRSSISVTTTGTGAASYNSTTGVINVPTPKKQETFSGTTSGSGTYTVTFSVPYSVAPNIQQTCTNCTDTHRTRITSITTTGFTVQGRSEALGLIFANANGLNVDVIITEK